VSSRAQITRDDVRRLIVEEELVAGAAADLDDDGEIAFDSRSLLWFLHLVEERFGIVARPDEGDADRFTSVRRIHEYLASVRSGEVGWPKRS
jgi:hypothetical protein